MTTMIPKSVRYVKNGRGGQWWNAAKTNNQIHAGWKIVPPEFLLTPDFPKINQVVKTAFGGQRGATQDFNALRSLLDAPSQHVWMTFQDGYMWWCTVLDGALVNPSGETSDQGNFCLACDRPWSNQSLGGRQLPISGLPGAVTTTAGFKGTVCIPQASELILRIIQDEKDPDAAVAAAARGDYQRAVLRMIQKLTFRDFEELIDHVLARSGWTRISRLGSIQEGVDEEVENLAIGEIAFVQMKGLADQKVLDDYIERFGRRRDRFARMIFAVHTPTGSLNAPEGLPEVQVWASDRVAELVVRLGLGEWVESRLA